MVRDDVMRSFLARDNVADAIADLRDRVAANEMLPSAAARALAEL